MFYYAILTDIEGTHSYCGCLLFYEPVVSKKTRPGSVKRTTSGTESHGIVADVEEEQSEMTYYVPKCLCLITRQEHLDTIKVIIFASSFVISVSAPMCSIFLWSLTVDLNRFPFLNRTNYLISYLFLCKKCINILNNSFISSFLQNCMTTIYSAYAESDNSKLEKMIGYALGLTNLPPPGGPKLTFSLGGEDTQAVFPPVNESIPISKKSVAIIFNQLGMHN